MSETGIENNAAQIKEIELKFALPELRFVERNGEKVLQQQYHVIHTDDSQIDVWCDVSTVAEKSINTIPPTGV